MRSCVTQDISISTAAEGRESVPVGSEFETAACSLACFCKYMRHILCLCSIENLCAVSLPRYTEFCRLAQMPQERHRLIYHLTKLQQAGRSTLETDFRAQRAPNTFAEAHTWSQATKARHVLAGKANTVPPCCVECQLPC